MTDILKSLLPLPPETRTNAIERSRLAVQERIGHEPQFEEFQNKQVGEYPPIFYNLVVVLLTLVFFAAGAISLFRVFSAARNHFETTLPGESNQAALVGLATFVLAEFMVIVSTIAIRTLFKKEDRSKWLMIVPIIMGILVAAVGNWIINDPLADSYVKLVAGVLTTFPRSNTDKIWSLIDTLVPPATVLFMAIILERVILTSLESRFESTRLYAEAHKKWEFDTANPEDHPLWLNTYASVLREEIKKWNSMGSGSKDRIALMASMAVDDWKIVVTRELRADEWFSMATPDPVQITKLDNAALPAKTTDYSYVTADMVLKHRPDIIRAIVESAANPNSDDAAGYLEYLDLTLTLLRTSPSDVSSTRLWYLKKKLETVLSSRGLLVDGNYVQFLVEDGKLVQTWGGYNDPVWSLTRPEVVSVTKNN